MDPFWATARTITPSRRIQNPILDFPDSVLDKISGHRPKWLVFRTTALAGNDQTELAQTSSEPFWALALLGLSNQNQGFTFTVFDSLRQQQWSSQFYTDKNGVGTGQRPFWIRRPHLILGYSPMLVRVQNLSTSTARIDFAIFGVCEHDHVIRPAIIRASSQPPSTASAA
jgi:hypothetical protein